MKVVGLFVIILIILLVLIGIFIFQFKLSQISPKWPYIFNLKNTGSQEQPIQVLVNGSIYGSYFIAPGNAIQVLLGNNVKNPRTGLPFQYLEVLNVAFYLPQDGNIQYDSPNSFKAPSFSSEDCTKDCYVASQKVGNKTYYFLRNRGYYTIFMQ